MYTHYTFEAFGHFLCGKANATFYLCNFSPGIQVVFEYTSFLGCLLWEIWCATSSCPSNKMWCEFYAATCYNFTFWSASHTTTVFTSNWGFEVPDEHRFWCFGTLIQSCICPYRCPAYNLFWGNVFCCCKRFVVNFCLSWVIANVLLLNLPVLAITCHSIMICSAEYACFLASVPLSLFENRLT